MSVIRASPGQMTLSSDLGSLPDLFGQGRANGFFDLRALGWARTHQKDRLMDVHDKNAGSRRTIVGTLRTR
jgi:hypothetical protein